MLLCLATALCRGRYTLTDLAIRLGPLTVNGLTQARGRITARAGRDRALRQRMTSIRRALSAPMPD